MLRMLLSSFLFLILVPINLGATEKTVSEASRLRSDLMSLDSGIVGAAAVTHLDFSRDAGKFTFGAGTFYRCKPLNGHTVALLFMGSGEFRMVPPSKIEREQLHRFYESDTIRQEFKRCFMLFADSTADEIDLALHFTPSESSREPEQQIRYSLKYLSDDGNSFRDEFLSTYLNGEQSALFYADFSKDKIEPFFFEINPRADEEVRFMHRHPAGVFHAAELICQFRLGLVSGSQPAEETKIRDSVSYCHVDAAISQGMDFSASTELRIHPRAPGELWNVFWLFPELRVDSLAWGGNRPVSYFRPDDSYDLWVRYEHPAMAAECCTLMVWYHGNLLKEDQYGFVNNKATHDWYPRPSDRVAVSYDLVFHTPKDLKFASIGTCVSEDEKDGIVTTRWQTKYPTDLSASFNIGHYSEKKFTDDGKTDDSGPIPPVTVFMTDNAHRSSVLTGGRGVVMGGSDMAGQVGNDVLGSVTFFQRNFGPCSVDHLYATEILERHGEAFPGLINLWWGTYQVTGSEGYDEIFRAHEAAHQWWGIGVDFRTYHDQWLSEAFAEYSALWYMQAALKDNGKFFNVLDRWKDDIYTSRHYLLGSGQEAGPIWLGYRTESSNTANDYDLIIYRKGAWVLHMLRMMLMDLQTMKQDVFRNIMKDFYMTYRGKRATTADFQRMVEKYTNQPMDWFFNEWVMDTRLPQYEFAWKSAAVPDGTSRVTCRIVQTGVPADFRMYIPLLIKFEGGKMIRLRIQMTGERAEFDLPVLPYQPTEIIFNYLHSVLCDVKNVSW
jgi:hypothetical protein